MIFTTEIIEEIEKLDPQTRSVLIKILKLIEKAIGEVVKREDFLELKKGVQNLTENVNNLAKLVAELIEAQKKAEERLTRLEQTVAELAEAQKRTEQSLKKLIEDQRKTRENLGGLAHTLGYFLENEAYKYLPALLKRDFNITVEGELIRDYVEVSPYNFEEINIIGKGRINGKEIIIIGESKTQLKKTDIDKFLSKVNKLEKLYPKEKIFLCVTHQAHPTVREYAKQKGVKIYFSYQFK